MRELGVAVDVDNRHDIHDTVLVCIRLGTSAAAAEAAEAEAAEENIIY